MSDLDVVDGPSFVKGDTDAVHDYPITRARVVFDATGYSDPVLHAFNQTTGEVVTAITGSWVSPVTGGVARFNHTTIAAVVGNYRCQIVTVHPTAGRRALKKDLMIPVRESVEDL